MENKNKEKKDINYEILCIIKENDEEKKDSLIRAIEDIISPNKVIFNSEKKKLAYPIEKMETAIYLLLNFKCEASSALIIKKIIRDSFVIRHMMINIDADKKIKISNYLSKKAKKPIKKNTFGKFPRRERNDRQIFSTNRFSSSDRHSSPIEIVNTSKK